VAKLGLGHNIVNRPNNLDAILDDRAFKTKSAGANSQLLILVCTKKKSLCCCMLILQCLS